MTELERRDLVVSGALPRHQMRSYLKALGVEWRESPAWTGEIGLFTITATSDQWEKINKWAEQTKVGP